MSLVTEGTEDVADHLPALQPRVSLTSQPTGPRTCNGTEQADLPNNEKPSEKNHAYKVEGRRQRQRIHESRTKRINDNQANEGSRADDEKAHGEPRFASSSFDLL